MAKKILIVDDEIDELAAWETALRRSGYQVSVASTAGRALELCDESMFDLVLLDFVMPKMRGLELLARIRKKIPLVRSIVVSGKLDQKLLEPEIKESIRGEVETDRYLHKPVSNEQLLGTIDELLKETPSSRAWGDIAADHIQGGKATVSKARGAQGKLKKHIRRKR